MMRGLAGPVVMLDLLRFREAADYRGAPELAPLQPIIGTAAYALYVAHTLPWLARRGGALLFYGGGGGTCAGRPDLSASGLSSEPNMASGGH